MSQDQEDRLEDELPLWIADPTLPPGYRSMVQGETLDKGDLYVRNDDPNANWQRVRTKHFFKVITDNDEVAYRFARIKTEPPLNKRFGYRTLAQISTFVRCEVWRIEAMVSCNYRELSCQICGGDGRLNLYYLRDELHRHLGGDPMTPGEYAPECQACEILAKITQLWDSEVDIEGPAQTLIGRCGPKLDNVPIELRTEIREHCHLAPGAAVPFTQYAHRHDCHATVMRDELLMLARHAGIFMDSHGLDCDAFAVWKGER